MAKLFMHITFDKCFNPEKINLRKSIFDLVERYR